MNARDAVRMYFLTPMLLAYEAPKTVAGNTQLEDALKVLILDAAVAGVPRDWPFDRCEVYAHRLWDECLLGKKYTAGWPTVDAVRKAGHGVLADMTEHDRPRALPKPATPQEPEIVLMGDEPGFMAFYWRMKHRIEDADRILNREGLLAMLETARRRHEARYQTAAE